MRHRVDDRDVRAGAQRQVVRRFGVRRAHEVDLTRVDDDELRAFAQAALHLRREHGVRGGRVRADHEHDVGLHHRVERLRAGGFAERRLEAEARGRVADARASVDVVVAERGAHELLDEIGLFVRAARRRDAADGVLTVLRLNALDLVRRERECLVPRYFAPLLVDRLADHRLLDPVLVGRVAEREPAFHARVAVVRVAVLVRDHAHDFLTLHLGAERAADAAVRAGRDDRMLGHALGDQRRLGERRGRTRLHARAARHAFGIEERLVLARADLRLEAAALDRERERALHFLAGAHAARADDALARIEREIRVALVLLRVEVVLAGVTVANLAQADRARHVLQLAVAIHGAGEAVERVIGDVELHDVAAHVRDALVLRRDLHAGAGLGGARRGQTLHAFDLDEAQAARAERLEAVGGAELRDVGAGERGGAQDGGTHGNRHVDAVDRERDLLGRFARRRS